MPPLRRARARHARERRDGGFTLVELLVTMLVLGVLVAIAIPVFLNQQDKAARTAVVADLRTLRIAQETRGSESNPRYTDDQAVLAGMGFARTDGVRFDIVLTDGDDEYLACGTHERLGEWLVYSSVAQTTSWSPVNDCA